MNQLIFFVQGSVKEPYKVTLRKIDNNFSAICTCRAGDNGQYCKHRLNILGGLTEGIVSGNELDVEVASAWLIGTDVEAALNDFLSAEEQFENAKCKFSAAKKRLAKAFRERSE